MLTGSASTKRAATAATATAKVLAATAPSMACAANPVVCWDAARLSFPLSTETPFHAGFSSKQQLRHKQQKARQDTKQHGVMDVEGSQSVEQPKHYLVKETQQAPNRSKIGQRECKQQHRRPNILRLNTSQQQQSQGQQQQQQSQNGQQPQFFSSSGQHQHEKETTKTKFLLDQPSLVHTEESVIKRLSTCRCAALQFPHMTPASSPRRAAFLLLSLCCCFLLLVQKQEQHPLREKDEQQHRQLRHITGLSVTAIAHCEHSWFRFFSAAAADSAGLSSTTISPATTTNEAAGAASAKVPASFGEDFVDDDEDEDDDEEEFIYYNGGSLEAAQHPPVASSESATTTAETHSDSPPRQTGGAAATEQAVYTRLLNTPTSPSRASVSPPAAGAAAGQAPLSSISNTRESWFTRILSLLSMRSGRSNSSTKPFLVEGIFVCLLGIVAVVAVRGKNANVKVANAWISSVATILKENFVVVGYDSSYLMMRSYNVFELYCTGRRNCLYLHAVLECLPRQCLWRRAHSFFFRNSLDFSDSISLEFLLPPTNEECTVCLCRRADQKQLLSTYWDLREFTKPRSRQYNNKLGLLPAHINALSDVSENLDLSFLNHKVLTQTLNSPTCSKLFKYLYLSDACAKLHPSTAATLLAEKNTQHVYNKPNGYRVLRLSFFLPPLERMEEALPLLRLALYLVDQTRHLGVSEKGLEAVKKLRVRSQKEKLKETEEQRQEQLERKRAERRRQGEEKYEKMTPEQQRKYEEKEFKKQMKHMKGRIKLVKAG